MFIGTAECLFETTPQEVDDEVDGQASALKTTKAAEDGFNLLRDNSRRAKSSSLGRKKRFHCLLTSTILDDAGRSVDCDSTVEATGPAGCDFQTPVFSAVAYLLDAFEKRIYPKENETIYAMPTSSYETSCVLVCQNFGSDFSR